MRNYEAVATLLTLPDSVECVAGTRQISAPPVVPYAVSRCNFLTVLGQTLLDAARSKTITDVAAFGFWCRKANLQRFEQQFSHYESRLGLGLAFHATPANVPTNFIYSFAFSFLAGNSNVVRLPKSGFESVQIICSVINDVLEDKEFSALKDSMAFIRYEKDKRMDAFFSLRCSARLIWGGDETIRRFRSLETTPRCVDLTFADRYSMCVLSSGAVAVLKNHELTSLAERFVNDSYTLNQEACSSPHLIMWFGVGQLEARGRFWNAVLAVASERYNLSPMMAVNKYMDLCCDAASGELNIKSVDYLDNLLYRMDLERLDGDIQQFRGSAGYFYEYETADLLDLRPIVTSKFQTLTYYGLDSNILRDIVIDNGLPGVDRVVPIGMALEMDVVWDGFDTVDRLSRVINVC